MRPSNVTSQPQPVALARAFLVLVDGNGEPPPGRSSAPRSVLALLVAVLVALALPLLWATAAAERAADHTAATLPHKTALVDDDEPAGGR